MTVYYNEHDPKAAAWLRELISAGHIAAGEVDERGIEDVRPDELAGFRQCHFFAGIGGWSYALRLAGWSDDRPVWTGSCPCQPFSAAGTQKGTDDERHLWPHFRWLIDQCRPAIVFGEQVASKSGRHWLAGVRTDLEALGYGVGAADLCAAGIGAPHIRQRLYWLADTGGLEPRQGRVTGSEESTGFQSGSGLSADSTTGGLGDAIKPGLEGHTGHESDGDESGRKQTQTDRPTTEASGHSWGDNWIPCGDGKARRIKPGLEPLVDGLPGRVGLLRGYGNAIVPQVAATFIESYLEAMT